MGLPCRNEYNYYEEPYLTNGSDYSEINNGNELMTDAHSQPKILVAAVGGGGGNALNYMIQEGMTGISSIAMNTDISDISHSLGEKTLLLGEEITRGLGAGATAEVGRLAARASKEEIRKALKGFDLVYIAACMGGGTGTGAAPVVAEVARDSGALTVAVVTKPFSFEGKKKARLAEEGIAKLRKYVDALIVIENDRIIASSQKNTTFADAITLSDAILANAVRGVFGLITNSGYINVDFADVKTILKNSGDALMGMASARGSSSVLDATKRAMMDILNTETHKIASGAILNIVCKNKATLAEIAQASDLIQEYLLEDAAFVLGHLDNVCDLDCDARVTVILSGITDCTPSQSSQGPEVKSNLQIEAPMTQNNLSEMQDSHTNNDGIKNTSVSNNNIPSYLKRLQRNMH